MATYQTEGNSWSDVIRSRDFNPAVNCEEYTVLDGQVMTIGKCAKLNSSSKAIVSAVAEDEVQTVIFGAAATGGTLQIGVKIPTGSTGAGGWVWTDAISWSATDATFLTNINAALDNVLGSSKIVATARSAVDTDLGFVLTFSGTGYTGLPHELVQVDTASTTSVTTATVTRTTAGHAAGGDTTMICLTKTSPSGADGKGVFIVRGPCVVNADALSYPTGGEAAARVALTALGIVCRDEPALTQVV